MNDDTDFLKKYDMFGNRIDDNSEPIATVDQVMEEDLGIVPETLETTDDRRQTTENELQTMEDGEQKTEERLQTTDDRLQIADDKPQISEDIAQKNEDRKVEDRSPIPNIPNTPKNPHDEANSRKDKASGNSRKTIAAICIAVIVGISGIIFIYASHNKQVSQGKNVLGVSSSNDPQSIVDKVASLVALPKDEQPSQIANISDVSKLQDNPFFANAQNGDMVLVYQKSKLGVLYRPSANKIVEIGPFDAASPTPTIIPSVSPEVTVAPTIKPIIKPTLTASPSAEPAQ